MRAEDMPVLKMSQEDQSDERQLDYDDSAFYCFAIVILTAVLLPLTYKFCTQALIGTFEPQGPFAHGSDAVIKSCKCADCHGRLKNLERKRVGRTRNFGTKAIVQLVLILAMLYLIFVLLDLISRTPEGVKRFDPFEILEISPYATDREIKTAFRRLSLMYHPDKNQGDPVAASRFIQTSKAYEALTNEVARKNFEKYGSPDGPTPMKVSIGLPSFLLNTEHHVVILVIFFVVLLILVPGSLIYWMSRTKRTDKNGVLLENTQFFLNSVSEMMTHRKILLLLAAAPEYSDIRSTQDQVAELSAMKRQYEEYLPNKQTLHPRVLKNYLLLISHMMRRELSPGLRKDRQQLLEKAGSLIETMAELSFVIGSVSRGKRMTIDPVSFMLEVSQLLTQAMWVHDSNLLMLPHVDNNNVKDFKLGKKAKLRQLNEKALELAKPKFSPDKFLDIQEALRSFPALKVTANAQVEGEEQDSVITEGDVVTVIITIERLHLKEGEEAGPVHSPHLGRSKYEKLWLFISEPDKKKLIYLRQLSSVDRVIVENSVKFQVGAQAPPFYFGQGTHRWEVMVKSDSYYELDVTTDLVFTVLPGDAVKKVVFVHPEDQALDKQTSWFQKVLGSNPAEESEESDEDAVQDVEELARSTR